MTDQELETIIENSRVIHNCHYHLVQLQDFIDQIALTATIVSNYGHLHPDTEDMQVRMIGRLAEQVSKILKKTEEKLDDAIGDINRIAINIHLERLRKQNDKPDESTLNNSSQVITNGKVN